MLIRDLSIALHTFQNLFKTTRLSLSRRLRLCGGSGSLPAATAVARRHRGPTTAAAIDMQQAGSQISKAVLYTVGFANGAAEVLPQHTGWPLLQEIFQVTNFPGPTITQQQAADDYSRVAKESMGRPAVAVVAPVGQQLQAMQQLRAACATLFVVCWHPNATEHAAMRWQAFQAGANMVTHCRHALAAALHQVSQQQQQQQQQQLPAGTGHEAGTAAAAAAAAADCTCDWCGLPGLSPSEYWMHQQLYHINHANKAGTCQVCGKYSHILARHLHDIHDPTGKPPEERTGVFALAIVRRPSDGKFLMTQEFAGSGFWVPGGGVDPGESLVQGALRECREEAGVEVVLRGILELESHHGGAWRRVIFFAEPARVDTARAAAAVGDGSVRSRAGTPAEGSPAVQQWQQQAAPSSSLGGQPCCNTDKPAIDCLQQQQQQQQQSDPGSHWHSSLGAFPCCSPKTLPDWESAGACWVAVDELTRIPLRSASEPCRWFPMLAGGVEELKEQLPLIDSLELPGHWAEGVFKGFPCQRSSGSSR